MTSLTNLSFFKGNIAASIYVLFTAIAALFFCSAQAARPLVSPPPLVVVHADEYFDSKRITQKELQRKINLFTKTNSPIYFLLPELIPTSMRAPLYFLPSQTNSKQTTHPKNRFYFLESPDGSFQENNLLLKKIIQQTLLSQNLYIAGGYFELCLGQALEEILDELFSQLKNTPPHAHPIGIHFMSEAIFIDPNLAKTFGQTHSNYLKQNDSEITLKRFIELYFQGKNENFIRALYEHPVLSPISSFDAHGNYSAPIKTKIKFYID